MINNNLELALKALLGLRQTPRVSRHWGEDLFNCIRLAIPTATDYHDLRQNELHNLCIKWIHYSGNKYYPVPDPIYKDTECFYPVAVDAAQEINECSALWEEGEYGDLMCEFLDYMIQGLHETLTP